MAGKIPSKRPSLGCIELMKYILILLNVLFIIFGCVLLFLGVWFYAVPANKNIGNVTLTESEMEQLRKMTLVVIGVAGCIVLFSIVACCGVLENNKCMLMFMILLTSAFLLSQIVICAFGFIFQDEIAKSTKNEMSLSLAVDYRGDNATDYSSVAWNQLQQHFSCCGVDYEGYRNYTEVTYYTDPSNTSTIVTGPTMWYQTKTLNQSWPHSCCSMNSSLSSFSKNAVTCLSPTGTTGTYYRHNIGCLAESTKFIQQHLVILAVIAACLALIEISSIFLYWKVYRSSDIKRTILI